MYVDYIIYMGSSIQMLNELKENMIKVFEMLNVG